MGLYEDAVAQLGQRPDPVTPYSFLGIPLNGSSAIRSQGEQQAYNAALLHVMDKLAEQSTNPFRQSTLGEVSRIGGHNPEDIASPSQLIPRVSQQPSEVPRIGFGEQMEPMGRFNFGLPQASLQPGPMIPVTRMEPNLEAPASLPQQMLGVSDLRRQSFQPRFNPNAPGGGALMQKYKILSDTFGHDAAARILAGEPLPGGEKEQSLNIRNRVMGQHGDLYSAQTEAQKVRTPNLQREYDDKHEDTESRIRSREHYAQSRQKSDMLRNQLLQLEAQLKQKKLRGDTAETRLAEERLKLLRDKLEFGMSAYLRKLDISDEERASIDKTMAEIAGYTRELVKSGWFSDTYEMRRNPKPGTQPSTPSTPSEASTTDVTAEINKLMQQSGQSGNRAKYKGQMYRKQGEQWVKE